MALLGFSILLATSSRKIEEAIAIWKNMPIVLAEGIMWDRAGNGSHDNDDSHASPMASNHSNTNDLKKEI
jgi:hypothetical protein